MPLNSGFKYPTDACCMIDTNAYRQHKSLTPLCAGMKVRPVLSFECCALCFGRESCDVCSCREKYPLFVTRTSSFLGSNSRGRVTMFPRGIRLPLQDGLVEQEPSLVTIWIGMVQKIWSNRSRKRDENPKNSFSFPQPHKKIHRQWRYSVMHRLTRAPKPATPSPDCLTWQSAPSLNSFIF